jgi:Resolvase, N terminal domain
MLNDAGRRHFDIVLVWAIDRLGRSLIDLLGTIQHLEGKKAEVESAKRRARFRLSMIGIQPGTELQLFKEPTIICKTIDDGNKVEFKGDITSLSDAAMQALQSIGIDWPTVSGPWEWAYQGKRLDEIRREIEDKSD